jgi:predicted transposase YdaD
MAMSQHDESYKKFFSHPQMVQDLLCGFIDAPWVKQLDFSTLEKVNNEYIVDKKLKKRANDVVWKVRCQDQWLYIYILLEFQSRPDASMPLRMMTYLGLLYLDLYETKQFTKDKTTGYPKLPPVLPLVLYNGKTPWHKALDVSDLIVKSPLGLEPYRPHLRYCLIDQNKYSQQDLIPLKNLVAALFRLEKSQNKTDIRKVLSHLIDWLNMPEQESLNRAFAVWLTEVALPKQQPDTTFPEISTLEGVNSMLAETIQGWYAEAEAKGKAIGEAKGEARGKAIGEARGEIQGELKGKAKSLVFLLETKFSTLSQEQLACIFVMEEKQIEEAMRYIFATSSLDDMFRFIKSLL